MPDSDFAAALSAAVESAKGEAGSVAGEAAATTAPEPEAPKTESAPEPVAEPAPAEPAPAPEPAKPDEDEFWKPTAEELAAIEADPKLQKVYKSMQRGLTKKSQEISAAAKANEEAIGFANWFKSDPAKAAREIAAHVGLTVAEVKKDREEAEERVVDALEEKWAKTIGPEAAKLLRPLIEETAAAVAQNVMDPIKATVEPIARAAQEQGTSATVREFGASLVEQGHDWDDSIQQEMADISKLIEPAVDENGEKIPMPQYLDVLYNAVMAKRNRQSSVKGNLDRLRRIRAEAEPVGSLKPAPVAEERVTVDMKDNEAIALAVRAAQRQLGRR